MNQQLVQTLRKLRLSGLLASLELRLQEATTHGTLTDGPRLDPDLLFEDVFKEMPSHLVEQREALRRERN